VALLRFSTGVRAPPLCAEFPESVLFLMVTKP
jgi:hypothetical protein